jgi:CheY-like chemotaxis protein
MKRKKPLICIIDDDKIYRFLLSWIINKNNLAENIISFSNGEEALQYLTDNKATNEKIPDAVFLDVSMPIMDGWQFMEEYATIKTEIKKKVVVFMLSSSVNPIDIERANNISEISDYIFKPIDVEGINGIFKNLETLLE